MTTSSTFAAIVLAAGQGGRMRSSIPKPLHSLAGRPMISYPVQAALDAGASQVIVVLGDQAAQVHAELRARFRKRLVCVAQAEPRGTLDAARCGIEAMGRDVAWALVLPADMPLISAAALRSLLDTATAGEAPLTLLTSRQTVPRGGAPIVRNAAGSVVACREHAHTSRRELATDEVSAGLYAVERGFFLNALSKLEEGRGGAADVDGTNSTDSAAGADAAAAVAAAQDADPGAERPPHEKQLGDLVALAVGAGGVQACCWSSEETLDANDLAELSQRQRVLRLRIAMQHASRGVILRDPTTAYIDADVRIEPDAVIEAMVSLRGTTHVASGAHIDVGCVLDNVRVGAGARIKPYTVAQDSEIERDAQIGPSSHLRPQSHIGRDARVGNFVETKKTRLGTGSKANHLTYLGDGVIGAGVNIGAGTIFCNYDGFNKHTTTLEDGCFVGSDSQLVAPVTIGTGAYVASGTTVTRDVPADALAIGRAAQLNKPGKARELKGRLAGRRRAGRGKP